MIDELAVRTILLEDFAFPVDRLDRDQVGLSNANWFAQGPLGQVVAKHYRADADVEHIEARIARLRAAGLPVPERLASTAPYRGLVVHRFVAGEHYLPSPQRLDAVAEVWRRLVALGGPPEIRRQTTSDLAWMQRVSRDLEPWRTDPDLGDLQRRAIDLLVRITPALEQRRMPLFLVPMHLDFHGRNLLFQGNALVLVCDWEHFGRKDLAGHLAESATVFAATPPAGCVDRALMHRFIDQVRDLFPDWDWEEWASLRPHLAMARHLRLMPLRFRLAARGREDVRAGLIIGALEQGEDLLRDRA